MLRLAGPGDAEAIADIHIRARETALPFLPVLHTREQVLDFFRDVVLARQHTLVFERHGVVTGFSASDGEWLNHLYVAPEYLGQGQGGALLRRMQSEQRQIQLWTFEQNRNARAFYRRHGFREVEFTDGSFNEERMPDVRLVWRRDGGP